MAASASRPAEVFEGHGYYRVTSAPAGGSGTWIDSRGLIMPVRVTISDDSFTSDWGGEGTEAGRTVYRLTGAHALEVVDFVRGADGAYKEFGRSQLGRTMSRSFKTPDGTLVHTSTFPTAGGRRDWRTLR
jgi:hypothetical protein